MPQTPCPEVQPDAIGDADPDDAARPRSSIGIDTGTSTAGIWPVTASTASGPLIMPASSASRQPVSGCADGVSTPARIPVAPMIRPSVSISSTEANPISTPPPSDCHGVNGFR